MTRGRPREFDREEALKQATLLFWRSGYRGVSTDDLTSAMNISKPSLYAAFGDKETLFLEAIEYYRNTVIRPGLLELLETKDLASGLAKFFKTLAKAITTEDHPGCLVGCMMAQEVIDSKAIRDRFAEGIERSDRVFAQFFAQHRSELKSSLDPEGAGQLLTSLLHGMTLRARSGASAKDLQPIAETAIKMLCKAAK